LNFSLATLFCVSYSLFFDVLFLPHLTFYWIVWIVFVPVFVYYDSFLSRGTAILWVTTIPWGMAVLAASQGI
jgi:hypothetical protein